MRLKFALFGAVALISSLSAGAALADEVIGERLTLPWQIIRQDRANYHKFRIRQDGDESDSFFSSVDNRAAAERMIRDGSITRDAARALVQGDVFIHVQVIGRGDVGEYLEITVE